MRIPNVHVCRREENAVDVQDIQKNTQKECAMNRGGGFLFQASIESFIFLFWVKKSKKLVQPSSDDLFNNHDTSTVLYCKHSYICTGLRTRL